MKLTFQQPGAREIKVKLLLAGGQSAALVVAREQPLLVQLVATVAAADGAAAGDRPSWFQIPMEGGRASWDFGADRLFGAIPDAAVVMHSDGLVGEQARMPDASTAVAAAAAASAAQGHGNLVRHPVAQLDGFLSGSEVAWLMELTFAAESRFVPARVSDDKEDYRHSFALAAPDALRQLFVAKITAVMPEVMPQLRLGQFALGAIDCQVTASVDGSYFQAHTDAGGNANYKRQFTYVYYFNREPKGFTGGELRIYDDTIRNGKLAATLSFQVIEPRHNTILAFH